jgi:LysM repeat protein
MKMGSKKLLALMAAPFQKPIGRLAIPAGVARDTLRRLGLAAVLPLVLMLGGCDKLLGQKGGDDALSVAHEKEREGDYRAAIQWYEASLDGTEKTAESHYAMALIFDDKLDDPVAALAQFHRYMELAPSGTHVSDAKSFADQDEFKLANTLSKGNFMPQQDAAKLKNQNFELQQELSDLRKQMTDMRAAAKVTPGGKGGEPVQRPIPPDARTYRVEPGDTLRSISRMFYGNPNRWQDIQDANFGPVDGTVKLRVGMELAIPKK